MTQPAAVAYAERYKFAVGHLAGAGWIRRCEGMFIDDTSEAPPRPRPRVETWEKGKDHMLLIRDDHRYQFTLYIPLADEKQLPAFLQARS